MAQSSIYPIKCPSCGHEQQVSLFESVDVKEDPSHRKDLLEGRLNQISCATCAFEFVVDKSLLYSDPDAGWMLYLHPSLPEEMAQAEEEFATVLADLEEVLPSDQKLPEVDLVLSRNDLIERIFVREMGLNPKVIEYIKYLIYTQNLEQFLPEEKILLLNADGCDENSLAFVVQDRETRKLETMLQYNRESYDSLLELLVEDGDQSLVNQLFPGPCYSARAYLMQDEI